MYENKTKSPRVLCIVGPTASGKTALAVAAAKALNGEVISCDSMQIYKYLSIGTAKPTPEEMDGISVQLKLLMGIIRVIFVGFYHKKVGIDIGMSFSQVNGTALSILPNPSHQPILIHTDLQFISFGNGINIVHWR